MRTAGQGLIGWFGAVECETCIRQNEQIPSVSQMVYGFNNKSLALAVKSCCFSECIDMILNERE